MGSSNKADLPIQPPPLPSPSAEPMSFLNMEPDPFAPSPAPSPRVLPENPFHFPPGNPLSPISSIASDSIASPSTCADPSSPQPDSSYDKSLRTPEHVSSSSNVRIRLEETPPNFLRFKPPVTSPIANPKKWINDAAVTTFAPPSSPLSPIPISLVQEHVRAIRQQDSCSPRSDVEHPKEPRTSEESMAKSPVQHSRPPLKKARSMSQTSDSASSHGPSQTGHSYHTAASPSPSPPSNGPGHSRGSPSDSSQSSSQSLRMPGGLHVEAPPSSFRLSSPPRKRNPRLKEVQNSPKPEAAIPGMWASGSIADVQMDKPASLYKILSPESPLRRSLEQEDKSSAEGSFETAYTRPTRRRRSRSIDLGKPNVPVPELPAKQEAPVPLSTQETILANLDSFVKAHSPIAWPLPPKLTVVIDPETGERWRNISPVSEVWTLFFICVKF